MSKKLKLKFFDGPQEALSYISAEIQSTLQDDLSRMEEEERQHYSAEDRREMKKRIADIEAVAPLVESASDLSSALQGLLELHRPTKARAVTQARREQLIAAAELAVANTHQ